MLGRILLLLNGMLHHMDWGILHFKKLFAWQQWTLILEYQAQSLIGHTKPNYAIFYILVIVYLCYNFMGKRPWD